MINDENTSSGESNFEKYFSYSIDSMILSFEDDKIIDSIIEKYPDFLPSKSEKDLRKIFLEILDDRKFLKWILGYYQINLKDLLIIIYRSYPMMFTSSAYVRKISSIVSKSRILKKLSKKLD